MSIFNKCSFEDALKELGISGWKITGTCNSIDDFKNNFYKQIDDDNFTQDESLFGFTFNDVESKRQELRNAEPMRLLREERNRRLVETDWMANSDVTMTDEWRTYRQALRDLPSTASPELDEQGNLTNVTWPTKPA